MDLAQVERIVVRPDQLAVRRLRQAVPLRIGHLHPDEALVVVVARDVEDRRGVGLHHIEVLAEREVVAVPHDVGGHVAQMDRIDRSGRAFDLAADLRQIPLAVLGQIELLGVAAQVGVGRDEEREVVVVRLLQFEIDRVDRAPGRIAEVARDESVGDRLVARGDRQEDVAAGFLRNQGIAAVGIGAGHQVAVRHHGAGHGFPLAGDASDHGGLLRPGRACGAQGREQKQFFHRIFRSLRRAPERTALSPSAPARPVRHFSFTQRICIAWLR